MRSFNRSNDVKTLLKDHVHVLQDLFGKKYIFNITFTELIHSPLLASFPDVVDQSDLMDVLRVRIIWIFTNDKKKICFVHIRYYYVFRNEEYEGIKVKVFVYTIRNNFR